jgi:2Fe-2S ferredoxin
MSNAPPLKLLTPDFKRQEVRNRMATITYIEFNGTPHTVEVKDGVSVMKAAINNNIPGIVAECGGACACATCHIYVDEQWMDKLPPMENIERDMLDFASGVQTNSRLSCRLTAGPELEGLVVKMPESQYS